MAVLRTLLFFQLMIDLQFLHYGSTNSFLVGSSNLSLDSLSLSCQKQKKCSECIQMFGCGWCKEKDHDLDHRCMSESDLMKSNCTGKENPRGTEDRLEGNKPGQKIEPQKVQLKLRKGEKRNITIQYTNEKNRPLDLYIVMDLSCTMKEHKTKVADLAETLANNLTNLTSKLHIGFGSFVDKPIPPFGYVDKPKSCSKDESSAVAPYGFKNHLSLTPVIEEFIAKVNASGISSNIDAPEGTLDGLLQSIVCTKQIEWRSGEGVRKLVVIATDGPFHFAGDGKLVNVVIPHDGNCYVDETNMYTHSTILDYPSIALLRQKVRENDVFVIFAVTEDQRPNYQLLAQQLHPFAYTEGIDNKDHSIISVIESVFKNLVNTVTMLNDYEGTYFDTKMFSKCSKDGRYEEGNQCQNVSPGMNLSFLVEIDLKDCPKDRNLWESNITIYPQSLNQDAMTIHLEMLCGCDCEEQTNTTMEQKDSQKCSNHGILQCGICKCDPEWDGPHCNCPNTGDNIDKCTDRNTGKTCNGRGQCDACGKCVCDKPEEFGGDFCECNNKDCERHPDDKGLCNEQANAGKCHCSKCECNAGFEGNRCQCSLNDVNCKDPYSNSTCNSGRCDCGRCVCDRDRNHVGKYCEIMHARVTGNCYEIQNASESCMECIKSRSVHEGYTETDIGKLKDSCKDECEKKKVLVSKMDDVDSLSDEEDKLTCRLFDDDVNGCRKQFMMRGKNINTKMTLLYVEIVCPKPFPIVEIAIACASALVLGGILMLLIWKVFTHLQDKKEYARFEKSITESSWNTQNPLYKATTSEFQNPAYTDS